MRCSRLSSFCKFNSSATALSGAKDAQMTRESQRWQSACLLTCVVSQYTVQSDLKDSAAALMTVWSKEPSLLLRTSVTTTCVVTQSSITKDRTRLKHSHRQEGSWQPKFSFRKLNSFEYLFSLLTLFLFITIPCPLAAVMKKCPYLRDK